MKTKNIRKKHQFSLYDPLRFPVTQEIGSVLPNHLTARILRRELSSAENLYRREFKAHYGCVNAIEFCHRGGEFMASGTLDFSVLDIQVSVSDGALPL